MLYISICFLICFVLYIIYKPTFTININKNYFSKVDQDKLNYQQAKDAKLEQRLEEQKQAELKRLEEEANLNQEIRNMAKSVNQFMEGE